MDKFTTKVNEMIELINGEKGLLLGDYRNAREIIKFYEKQIQELITKVIRLERYNNETISYLHSTLKVRPDYLKIIEDRRLDAKEMIDVRYSETINNKYLRTTFDFYGLNLRLGAHERTQLAQNGVFQTLLNEKEELTH